MPRIQVLDARNHVVTGDPASAVRPPMHQLSAGRSSQRAVLSHPAFLAASGLGTDELARLGGTLNEMLDSLETSVGRQRRFVADAAHEMRTPVAGMTTALEVAQTYPETSQTLVEDLLDGPPQARTPRQRPADPRGDRRPRAAAG